MSEISNAARKFRERAQDEAMFLETCDGGDPGTPEQPSIWLFGIEPGWSLTDEANDASYSAASSEALSEYGLDLQMQWPFNKNAFKLLAALEGHSPHDYIAFAQRARPFVRGSTGYLKGNLFPEPFNNVGEWDANAVEATGFPTKPEYQAWMREKRHAVMRRWLEKSRPRLLVGIGTTFVPDFLTFAGATGEPETIRFEINGHAKRMVMAMDGIVPLAVVPHLTGGANGLNSYKAIAEAARIIRERVLV